MKFLRAIWFGGVNFVYDGCFNHCAAISYYALLSVVPFLSFLASIIGWFLGSSEEGLVAATERLQQLSPELPTALLDSAARFSEFSGTLGIASLAVTLWISHLVFAATQTAVGQIFHRPPVRMDWRHFALATLWAWAKPFLMFFGATTFLVAAVAFETVVDRLRDLDSAVVQAFIALVETKLLAFLVVVVVFALILQALTPQILRLRHLIPGALLAALGWELAQYLFSEYLANAASTRTYSGSAAAAVLFMLWIYYAAAVLLYSLQVVAVLTGDRQES